MSDDGLHGLTVIAFIGSVFSPYYAWARGRGRGDPAHHCTMHAVLYGKGAKRWAMTERGRNRLSRDRSTLAIGPSTMRWDGSALTVELDEVTAPLPQRIRGRVRLHPQALTGYVAKLDAAGRHRWHPIAPAARVEVELDRPSLSWSGTGYHDTNSGDAPLEADFASWNWSRGPLRQGTAVLYDVIRKDGEAYSLALDCKADGEVEPIPSPALNPLPRTLWGIGRTTRSDAGHQAKVRQTLTDSPFYARSLVDTHLLGEPVTAMHESLSMARFTAPWVQLMLPFRMPRLPG